MKSFAHLFALIHIKDSQRLYFGNPEITHRRFDIAPHHGVGQQCRYVAVRSRKPGQRAVTYRVRRKREHLLKLELTDEHRLAELIKRGNSRMKTAEPRYLFSVTGKHRRLYRMQVFYTRSIN